MASVVDAFGHRDKSEALLSAHDFFPMSILAALGPLLRLIGMGSFSIRPHPLCGSVAFLVPSGDGLVSVASFLDIPRFFAGIVPLLPLLAAATDLGWNLGRKLRSLFNDCLLRSGVPDVVGTVLACRGRES